MIEIKVVNGKKVGFNTEAQSYFAATDDEIAKYGSGLEDALVDGTDATAALQEALQMLAAEKAAHDVTKQALQELLGDSDKPNLAEMSVEELVEYARLNNIDIGNATSHGGILKKITEAGAE